MFHIVPSQDHTNLEAAGSVNKFETMGEALASIADVQACGEDFASIRWEVVECPEDACGDLWLAVFGWDSPARVRTAADEAGVTLERLVKDSVDSAKSEGLAMNAEEACSKLLEELANEEAIW